MGDNAGFPDNKAVSTDEEIIPLDVQIGRVLVKNSRGLSFPIFVLSISIIQALLFYYGGDYLWLYLAYDPFRRHEIWRYLTVMLPHFSEAHLWSNIVFQVFMGSLLEMVYHWKRLSVIYVAGVIGGSLVLTVVDPQIYSAGASAGVYALLSTYLTIILMNWKELDYQLKYIILFWLPIYVIFEEGINAHTDLELKQGPYTSQAVHFGGALFGFVLAVFVLQNLEEHNWKRRFKFIISVLIGGLFGAVIVVNLTWPVHYRRTEWNTNYVDTFTRYYNQTMHDSDTNSYFRELCMKYPECRHLLQEPCT